jgi:hypothetical protein
MRISTISAFAILWVVLGSQAAQAANDGPWCYRDFSGPQFSNCVFSTAKQCLAIAGTIGGVCERNHARVVPQPSPRKEKRQRS